MTAPLVIDAHHHVWDLTVREQDWLNGPGLEPLRRNFSPGDLRPLAHSAGVAASVLVQTVTVPEETPEMLALAASDSLIAGVVGWTALPAPDVAGTLEALRQLPGGDTLVGIRHQVQSEPDPQWLVRDEVLRGLNAVADADLAYDFVILPHQLPAATAAARRVPHLRCVLDHAGKPDVAAGELQPWAAELRRFATEPNTVCKLSGLVTEAHWDDWSVQDLHPFTEIVLDSFGPDRVMYGSDWPVCTLAAGYGEVLDAARALTDGLSEGERAAVFGATAQRAYRLATSGVPASG